MIQLKDCTKEELIYFIEHQMFFKQSDFEYMIKQYRSKKYSDMAEMAHDKASHYMQEYGELCKKYNGWKMIDVPMDDLKRMSYLEKESKKAYKESDRLWNKSLI